MYSKYFFKRLYSFFKYNSKNLKILKNKNEIVILNTKNPIINPKNAYTLKLPFVKAKRKINITGQSTVKYKISCKKTTKSEHKKIFLIARKKS